MPLEFFDPLGLDLTEAQKAAIAQIAQAWTDAKVPYVYGGASREGADCSGSVSAIYKEAGIDVGRFTSATIKASPLFAPVVGPPQVGDIGVYPKHVDLYGGSLAPGRDVWSASHPGGRPFGPANSGWYGTPVWYRYIGN